MGRVKRYRTALSRHHRSAGHGIHSPFAYRFVLDVLRERNPYYCYGLLHELRHAVIAKTKRHFRHPRIISFKNAKLIFRVTNFFNPPCVLQIGTSYGVSAVAVKSVSKESWLHLYEPHIDRYPVVADVLSPLMNRLVVYDSFHDAFEACRRSWQQPFVLINDLPRTGDYEEILNCIVPMLQSGVVVIMRNLSRNPEMKRLWLALRENMTSGHSYTNEKLAVIVANPKLPRQHFFLWF